MIDTKKGESDFDFDGYTYLRQNNCCERSSNMKGCMFNIDGGYLEGLCRGFKCGILQQSDYLNLVQCETLEGKQLVQHFAQESHSTRKECVQLPEICNSLIINSLYCCQSFSFICTDLKLHLAGTDYGSFLANEPSPLSVSVIDDKLREKLVVEFQHMRNHSVEPLSQFLDFITYSYMIDNIILLITGTLHQRPISELIPKCHPLGSFEQMEAIHVAATPAELYNAVLVDTPLGMRYNLH